MPRRKLTTVLDESEDEDITKQPQRNAANARERARMRVLSKAFCRLKTTLPWVPADTKLSKLDTLRLATSYIAHLKAVLMDQPIEEQQLGAPLAMTWPFNFPKSDLSCTDINGTKAEAIAHSESRQWHIPIQPVIRDEDVSCYY